MGKRRNLKRRDNEVEGEGSGSDVTLSAVENEHDSAEESDMGAREGANTRRENVNFEQPLGPVQPAPRFQVLSDRDEDPVVMQQNVGIETDTEGHAEGDGARPRAGENNEVTRAMKEMTTALVNTIKESNRAINQNLNNVLEQVQRRQAAERVITAQNRSNRTERGRRSVPNPRRSVYSRSGFSDTDEDGDDYPLQRQQRITDPMQQREITKLPIFTGKEPWNVWFNRFTEVADRRNWTDEDRLDEILPRLQGAAGEFVFGQLRREVRGDYAHLVSELNSRFRVVVTKKTYGAQFSHRCQKANESVEEYAAELKRLYDKAQANRDEETRREDLLRRFLDGLYDEKARFQVEYIKEPSDIDEAVYQVVDFQETRHRPLMGDGNGDRRGRKHARAVRFDQTEYEDSDDESDGAIQVDKKVKRKRGGRARKAVVGQTETSVKAESGKQAEKNTQGQKQSSDSDLERTLKALQDKIVSLERQLQQKGNSASAAPQQSYVRPDIVCYHCSEAGHFARECPQKQQGRKYGQFNSLRGQRDQGAYYRGGSSYSRNNGNTQAYQGMGSNSSQPLN